MKDIGYLRICFSNIRQRTCNPKNPDYRFYGAKGVKLCTAWKHRRYGCYRFMLYILDTLGHRPPGHVIDRISNDLGYQPGNLRWSTVQQSEHNKRPGGRRKVTLMSNVAAGII